MALFQKKSVSYSSNLPSYNIHYKDIILVVGLGNPGREYQDTRHNVGFEAVEAINNHYQGSTFKSKKDWESEYAEIIIDNRKIILLKPQTFMNESGRAVSKVANFYKITPDNTITIHDELDINFGQIRIGQGGGSAGHNGIKSIINTIGESFYRIRVGIGPKNPPQMDSADYVLAKFSDDQQKVIPDLNKEIIALLNEHFVKPLQNQTRTFIF